MDRHSFLRSALTGLIAAFTASCSRNRTAPLSAAAPGKTEKLLERVIEHHNAALAVGAVFIGDRLGLFAAMAGAGPLTPGQLAAKAGGLPERYVLEWLRVMATSRYMDYLPDSGAFHLSDEHAAVLADSNSPAFAAGWYESVIPDLWMIPRVIEAFKSGKGIPYGDYPRETFSGIERSTKPDYDHFLTQQWLPAVSGVVEYRKSERLEDDIGSPRQLAYGYGLLECLPTALAENGPGYGTGIAEPDVRALSQQAGFKGFERILGEDPIRSFFVLRA